MCSSDLKGQNKAQVVQQIIKCLKDKTKNKRRLQKYIMQLEILSNLRNLQPEIIKQLNNMSITYDVKTDLRYLQGEEEGEKKGIKKGKEEGKEEGGEEMLFVIKLLKKGVLPIKEIAAKAGVSIEKVLSIKKELEQIGLF